MSREIDYLGEGPIDDAIARKLILAVRATPGVARRTPVAGNGKTSLDRRLAGINAGLTYSERPILVLRDLDFDANCASDLVDILLKERHPCMLLRICVRESEAWLLADAEAYSRYCGVATSKLPLYPDEAADPKQVILSWKGRASPLSRHLQQSRSRGVPEWAALAGWNNSFIEETWNPIRAASSGRSESLCRAVKRLQELVKT